MNIVVDRCESGIERLCFWVPHRECDTGPGKRFNRYCVGLGIIHDLEAVLQYA